MKTFKEVVEEGKGEFDDKFVTTECTDDTCYALYDVFREEATVKSVKEWLDTFAAKIRQATLAEVREKIDGMKYTVLFKNRHAKGGERMRFYNKTLERALTALEDKEESV
jgi:hypothetical protein